MVQPPNPETVAREGNYRPNVRRGTRAHAEAAPRMSAFDVAHGLELNQLVANGVSHEIGGGREIQFPQRRCPMAFNGLEADREDIGNLLVSVPFGDELDHGFLARRKSMLGSRAGFSQKRSEQRLRHARGKEWLVLG